MSRPLKWSPTFSNRRACSARPYSVEPRADIREAVNQGLSRNDTDGPEVLKAFNTELAVGISAMEFAPDQLLNWEQAATILTRVFRKANLSGWTWASDAEFTLEFDAPEPFVDHDRISDCARESVYFMAAGGIVSGTGNEEFTLRAVTAEERVLGCANATREQALLLAVRLVESR